jgi:hypothetical protein
MLAALQENTPKFIATLGDHTKFLEVIQRGCLLLSEMPEVRYVLFVARNKSHVHTVT